MFEDALNSHLPVIGVWTDDLINFTASLQLIAKRKVLPWPTLKTAQLGPYLYYTDKLEVVTADVWKKLCEGDHQLVVINPDKKSSLVFDAGVLPTPVSLLQDYLKPMVLPKDLPSVLEVLKGLSLKTASEVVQLTMTRTGGVLVPDLRRTRTMISGSVQGLQPVDTDIDFYVQPPKLSEWLTLNDPYFLNPKTPLKLMPRGLMLAGSPGVGKSMGAKAIAQHFKIPLFRLDIATTLNKYIGESESRVARSLQMVEREAPCVLLVDEVEKVFGSTDDQGVTTRILSQLLWWLSDHRSKVLTVMTTNNLQGIPPELYRPGRLDMVLTIPKLSLAEAKTFSVLVFKSVLVAAPTMKQQHTLHGALEAMNTGEFAHSEVAEAVYLQIKLREWLPPEVWQSIAKSP